MRRQIQSFSKLISPESKGIQQNRQPDPTDDVDELQLRHQNSERMTMPRRNEEDEEWGGEDEAEEEK